MSFAEKIKEYIEEEKTDCNKYKELAETAPEKYAPIIRDIAREEETHRKHLEDILADCGGCSATDEEEAEEETEMETEKEETVSKPVMAEKGEKKRVSDDV